MAGGSRTRRGIALAVIALVAAACAGSAHAAEHTEAAQTHASAPCEHPGQHELVQGIAWDEIGRLHALGYPVCDIVWAFASPERGHHVGYAYPHFHEDDPRPFIVLEPDPDMWPDELDTAVRSLVRHEFGHALIYMAGIDDVQLGAMFDGALDLEPEGNHAHEAAAEAVSHLLTPEGDPRWWCYDKYIVPKNQDAAQQILDDARA